MRRLAAIALLVVLLGASAAAHAAERLVATQYAQTTIRAYAGTAVFSRFDGSVFHLATTTAGRAPVDLPVAPQAIPFDADIGPGPDGRPAIVFSTCDAHECRLALLRAGAATPQALTATHAPGQREVLPSIWRDRIAFAREGRVYVRALRGGRSLRLPGVPAKGVANEVELAGPYVALTTSQYDVMFAGVCGRRRVTLVNIAARRARTVAETVCGLNGQHFAGPTFAGAHLYFARTCGSDAGACGARPDGAYRLNLRSGRYEQADLPAPLLYGWSYDANGRDYAVYDPTRFCTHADASPDRPCRIARRSGLRFTPIKAPLYAPSGSPS